MRNLIRSCMRAPLLLLVGIAAAIPAQAAYDYTAIDFPGAVGASQAFGINNSGQIAGDTLTGIGFVYDIKKNTYTAQPTAPDTTSTTAIGINNPGVTVGGATDPSGVERGAIFDKGSYTLFANPGWFSTEARGISNNGMVTGYSADSSASNLTGFLYDPKSNSFTNFLPSPETIAQGINSRGDIVGDVFLNPGGAYTNSPQGFYGFLRHKNGTIVFFNVNGSVRTKARGVSESGAITGWFIDAVTGVQRGFVTSLSGQGGFQSLTTDALLDVPGSTATIAEGIDSQGRVCGNWFDASGGEHGFLATPVK